MKKVLKYNKDYYILPKKRIIMKKLFISTLFTSSSILAFDIASGLKTLGISAESVGQQLFDYVKEKKTTTVAAAKSYCTQASEYKSFFSGIFRWHQNRNFFYDCFRFLH